MPLPDRDGRFRAYPAEWGVAETGPNNLVTFTCRWRITEWYSDKEQQWYNFEAQDAEITSYSYLQKRDGSANQSGIDQLVAALEWDGRDLEFLAVNDWTKRGCSIVTAWDTYQGKTRLKVQWIDGWDVKGVRVGKIEKADKAGLKALQAKFGGQLRATTPKSGDSAPPPAGSPAPAPPPPPAPPPAGASAEIPESEIPF